MWPALIIRSPYLKFLLLSLVLAQRQISSLLNINFSYKSFSHLCCNVKTPRLATPSCIFRDVTRISYILCRSQYVHLMSGNRFTSKNSCPGIRTFAFPHVLINNYFYKYRTKLSVHVSKTRSLRLYISPCHLPTTLMHVCENRVSKQMSS